MGLVITTIIFQKPFSKDAFSSYSQATERAAPLGMESGEIGGNQLNQPIGNTVGQPHAGRLFYNGGLGVHGGWKSSANAWYQIDLYIMHYIFAIVMQGSANEVLSLQQFSIQTSNDTKTWVDHEFNGTLKVSGFHLKINATIFRATWPIAAE